jgi:energy-coupling factor transport system permease protein
LAHPAVSLSYFAGFFLLFFLFPHPAFLLTLWGGAFAYTRYTGGRGSARAALRLGLLLAVVLALFNTVFNHRGVHVIALIAGRRYTWEALTYGLSLAGLLSGMLLLCTILNRVPGPGQLLSLTSRALPQTAFILNMTLRYAGYVQKSADTYFSAQSIRATAAGEGGNRLRRYAILLNGFIAWMLEDGMQAVETLRAKEYGQRRRTVYAAYAFGRRDAFFLTAILALLLALLLLRAGGAGTYDYFRAWAAIALSAPSSAAFALLALYVLFPFGWDALRR